MKKSKIDRKLFMRVALWTEIGMERRPGVRIGSVNKMDYRKPGSQNRKK